MQSPALQSDDSMLLRLYAAEGDPAAFAELVRRYADLVYSTARRVTGSASAAEDVAQDCFLRLAQGSAAISGSLAGWLHRASLNRSLEVLRSERARRRREAEVATRGGGGEESLSDDSKELIAHVDEALAGLPDELRLALTEHFLLGRTQADMAAAAGVHQSTISRRIDSGLAQLRQKLREQDALPASLAMLPSLYPAPQTLRGALTKIGLSGVRAVAAPAATGASHLLLMAGSLASAVVVVALAAGGIWYAFHGHSPNASSVAPATGPAKVAVDQLPQGVRQTLQAQANGGKIEDLERRTENGKTIYEADVTIAGKSHEIQVAGDGKLISDKVEDEHLDLDLK